MEYYTIDGKILHATSLIQSREYAEAKLKLEDVLESEPDNTRAHLLIACIYCFVLRDFENAHVHFRCAMRFGPENPDSYSDYILMLSDLNLKDELLKISARALNVSGVDKAFVYYHLGLSNEKNGNYPEAIRNFELAFLNAIDKDDMEKFEECITRIETKLRRISKFVYILK